MEGSVDYLTQLGAALDKRGAWIATALIPRLKEAITAYQALFEGAMAMLIRKGLLREDPYQYDQAFTEIVVPKDDPLPEFENTDEVSFRLSAFRRQLKHLSAECPLDLPSLGLARLKKISALLSYINWVEFGEGSKSPTTRAFARAFMKVRMGSDSMASQILKDCEVQIVKTVHQIRASIADLISYNRESWKAELRRKAMPQFRPAALEGKGHREEAQQAIRRSFASRMPDRPWYPALAEEVLDEELDPEGPARKEKILAALAVPVVPAVKTVAGPEGKTILLEAVRMLCRPHEELATAQAVLEENERLLYDARGAGGGWLRRLLGIGSAPEAGERVYKVKYTEPGTAVEKTETLDFKKLMAEITKQTTLLAGLSSASGQGFRRMEAASKEQLADFVDRQLNELALIHRRLGSLNTLFQSRAAQEKKTARGIKVELLALKNGIVKANNRRHEYKESVGG